MLHPSPLSHSGPAVASDLREHVTVTGRFGAEEIDVVRTVFRCDAANGARHVIRNTGTAERGGEMRVQDNWVVPLHVACVAPVPGPWLAAGRARDTLQWRVGKPEETPCEVCNASRQLIAALVQGQVGGVHQGI